MLVRPVLAFELDKSADRQPGSACSSSGSASRRGRRSCGRRARRCTRSTGCRSAASSSSRARTATNGDDPRSFAAQGCRRKLVILVAGVAMNVLLAFVIFTGHRLAGDAVSSASGSARSSRTRPPRRPGLQPGDAIVAVDGERYQFLTGPSVLDGLRSRGRRDRRPRRSTTPDGTGATSRSPCAREAEVDAEQGALGISGVERPFEAYFFDEYYDRTTFRRRSASAPSRRSGALGPDPRRARRASSARAPPTRPRRRPFRSGRHRDADRRHLLEQRPDPDAVRRRRSCRPTWPWSTSCRSRRSTAAGC